MVHVVRDRGPIPTVTPSSGREQARINAREYLAARDAALAVLDPLLASRRNGYLPRGDFDRMRDIQAAIRTAHAARTHAARMKALRPFAGTSATNPIEDFARAINEAPAVADAPFALRASHAPVKQPKQETLF